MSEAKRDTIHSLTSVGGGVRRCALHLIVSRREKLAGHSSRKRGLFASNCRSSSGLIVLQTAPFSAGNQAHLIQFVCEAHNNKPRARREFSFFSVVFRLFAGCDRCYGEAAYPYVHN
jgi:hypothetical protein